MEAKGFAWGILGDLEGFWGYFRGIFGDEEGRWRREMGWFDRMRV